ncbi:hypothetical protein Taro_017922 [Colocasia esculenta]|uniref:Fibronectin type-III domain-containing protein n=1 Tax=Colocasia esculenta TaxID=4460 RepID=A0A843V0W0_COLES|nr:hypothetical protein [Colocasia esculenta]
MCMPPFTVNIPEEDEMVYCHVKDQDSIREPFNSTPKMELNHSSFDKGRTQPGAPKSKIDQKKRNLDLKSMAPSGSKLPNVEGHPRKQMNGENPNCSTSSKGTLPESEHAKAWICKNSACKAVLSSEDTFCRRCSCCICHLFDDNKDPSLWLVCASESSDVDSCGLSCHIECAIQHQKAGVVNLGESLQIEGSYCCASCGKVSGILGSWKKQLAIAKDARRVDVLCYRICLSYKLLDGTSRFKVLHEIVRDAKEKLENEVGPLTGVSAKMARSIVSRLSVACDVQRLCSLAIEKADECLCSISQTSPNDRKYSLPAACRFLFENITASSVVIVLKETCLSESSSINGYKLWYFKSREQPLEKTPVIFPRNQRRILVSNLQPCTEYTFKIISFTESGDFGHSESKCFTRSIEIIHKSSEKSRVNEGSSSAERETKPPTKGSSSFKVRDLGKILRLAWARERSGLDGFCSDCAEEGSCGVNGDVEPEPAEQQQTHCSLSCGLDLNVLSVLGMNTEFVGNAGSSQGADIGCISDKNGLTRSDGSDDSQTCAARQAGDAVESNICRKRAAITSEEIYDSDSTLINGSPPRFLNGSSRLDDYYEYCVKVIRWLECGGHIGRDFRMKFLTWFSLRSTDQERRVVRTFIKTLLDDPGSLAGQLADSFSGIIACKRQQAGSFSKTWH